MENFCEKSQEAIATGGEFSVPEREHLETCNKCRSLLAEYQSLILMVSESIDADVPFGFADAVLNKIETEEKLMPVDWAQKISDFFDQRMAVPQAQYLALGVGGAVSLMNLVRFVFFVLIPT
jgi:anti-sigma factor RsiW